MDKIKKAASVIGATIALTIGGAAISMPANAIAVGHPDIYKINCVSDTKTYYTWRDYNWFEEVFLGKRDGYVSYYWVTYRC
jgi:hypothetical protein